MLVAALLLLSLPVALGSEIVSTDYTATCGVGTRRIDGPYEQIFSQSRSHCLVTCSQNEQCTAVNYHHQGGMCELFAETLLDCSADELAASPNVTFYQRRDTEMSDTEMICIHGSIEAGDYGEADKCLCEVCWAGKHCDQIPTDCTEAYDYANPVYIRYEPYICTVRPIGSSLTFEAHCLIDAGGWTYIQYRADCDNLSFEQNWESYKTGFGSDRCYWMGLEMQRALINQKGYATLAVQMRPQGHGHCFAQGYYTDFQIEDEARSYKMTVGSYHEWTDCSPGDSLLMSEAGKSANGMKFSTPDRDNDMSSSNCAQAWRSGWWFNDCTTSNINGLFKSYTHTGTRESAISVQWKNNYGESNLEFTAMIISIPH